jgi:hypothetical protein
LGRCLDRTRNKLPDSDNAWLKTGGNVSAGFVLSQQRACRNSSSPPTSLDSYIGK